MAAVSGTRPDSTPVSSSQWPNPLRIVQNTAADTMKYWDGTAKEEQQKFEEEQKYSVDETEYEKFLKTYTEKFNEIDSFDIILNKLYGCTFDTETKSFKGSFKTYEYSCDHDDIGSKQCPHIGSIKTCLEKIYSKLELETGRDYQQREVYRFFLATIFYDSRLRRNNQEEVNTDYTSGAKQLTTSIRFGKRIDGKKCEFDNGKRMSLSVFRSNFETYIETFRWEKTYNYLNKIYSNPFKNVGNEKFIYIDSNIDYFNYEKKPNNKEWIKMYGQAAGGKGKIKLKKSSSAKKMRSGKRAIQERKKISKKRRCKKSNKKGLA